MRVRNRVILAVLGVLVIISIPVSGVAADKLSFTPPAPCKKPPKSPPIKLLNQFFPDIEGDTKPDAYGVGNQPFETNVDINGDGWCDWISLGGMAPHRSGDSPTMKNFLFLGTKTGWRNFGEIKGVSRNFSYYEMENVISPVSPVSAFKGPLFVYSPIQDKPYVIVAWTSEDIITPWVGDVSVYRWDDDVDMLKRCSSKERASIISFVRESVCGNPALSYLQNDWNQTLDAICDKKTPAALCHDLGNCDEPSAPKTSPPSGVSPQATPYKKY
jgi:hypothetical protein